MQFDLVAKSDVEPLLIENNVNFGFYERSIDNQDFLTDAQNYHTPEAVRVRAEIDKNKLKLEHAKLNSFKIKNNLKYELPCSISKIIHCSRKTYAQILK